MKAFRFMLQVVVFIVFAGCLLMMEAGKDADPVSLLKMSLETKQKPERTPKPSPVERMRVRAP